MINIVLVEPEIPQNTGNISRTCACTGAALHLVRPFGFELSDRTLKRAGLDYWDKLTVYYYDSLQEFLDKHKEDKLYLCTTKAKQSYVDVSFPDGCYLLFGKETKGLPEELIYSRYDDAIRIPMRGELRSLNLSNSVAIVLYEALRQHDFYGFDTHIEE
ncbi:MAG: tRNA (uridine(34)/cytosine(34)/5-carboxymethylaminomethyluridine(34)-2'-O)-methyltransferase TrmL [Clostridia bacterium]|nr:tRNA (uridine(34)/cytosine(34)/5-carboxymethylaminomethyluridine(34)-2'-O)-methyltransferase TrmL [Clostridia bacterium]